MLIEKKVLHTHRIDPDSGSHGQRIQAICQIMMIISDWSLGKESNARPSKMPCNLKAACLQRKSRRHIESGRHVMSHAYTMSVDDCMSHEAIQPNSKPDVVSKTSGRLSWPHRSRLVHFMVTIVQDGPMRSESGQRLSSIAIERISNINIICHKLKTVVEDIPIYVRAQTQNKLAVATHCKCWHRASGDCICRPTLQVPK